MVTKLYDGNIIWFKVTRKPRQNWSKIRWLDREVRDDGTIIIKLMALKWYKIKIVKDKISTKILRKTQNSLRKSRSHS